MLTVLARFGTEQYPLAQREIAEIFLRQMPDVDRSVLVVDNALPNGYVDRYDSHVLIGGDNSVREFSAFDRAVSFVGDEIWRYDLIHFATSAFNTLYTDYLQRFTSQVLLAARSHPACLGHIDCYNEPVEILGIRTQHWIRSCFFMLPPAEVKALKSFVSVRDRGRFFSGLAASPFCADAPLSSTYRGYVLDWLTGNDIGQDVKWHSGFALHGDTMAEFQHKALSIFNEHLLAVRLRAMGCGLIDVTWLSTHLPKDGGTARLAIDWRSQLATRACDALVLRS